MAPAVLDHLVVNTRFATDAAQALFAGLGFTLTPRGCHSLGSVNHLAVFPQGYLELVGLPLGTGRLRQEILDSPTGIDGLVLATSDALATHAQWTAQGLALRPVQDFSRPVAFAGGEGVARFSTARLEPGQCPGGRIYACQHHTPELVWRPEWQAHANGVQGMAELVVVSADPAQARQDYARLGAWGGDFALTFSDAAGWAARFGALAAHAPQRREFFGAIRFRGADPVAMAARASALGLPRAAREGAVAVALPALHTLLEFTP
ncbi:MAG: hypothetical protein ABT02_08240 [Comamonadaceae bacterium SCN 68-20]|nr:VOC family protein [Comamonadaceae bacterium]ODU59989.1 MAG: hypothetical protein ABT02_08240 [Comamonadaceae bacterium SCN 68-20]OJX34550.1 MAG: hypothetical protein BGO75_12985 [Burkholderiales bacterium 68-20]